MESIWAAAHVKQLKSLGSQGKGETALWLNRLMSPMGAPGNMQMPGIPKYILRCRIRSLINFASYDSLKANCSWGVCQKKS